MKELKFLKSKFKHQNEDAMRVEIQREISIVKQQKAQIIRVKKDEQIKQKARKLGQTKAKKPVQWTVQLNFPCVSIKQSEFEELPEPQDAAWELL